MERNAVVKETTILFSSLPGTQGIGLSWLYLSAYLLLWGSPKRVLPFGARYGT